MKPFCPLQLLQKLVQLAWHRQADAVRRPFWRNARQRPCPISFRPGDLFDWGCAIQAPEASTFLLFFGDLGRLEWWFFGKAPKLRLYWAFFNFLIFLLVITALQWCRKQITRTVCAWQTVGSLLGSNRLITAQKVWLETILNSSQ